MINVRLPDLKFLECQGQKGEKPNREVPVNWSELLSEVLVTKRPPGHFDRSIVSDGLC